VLPLEQFGAGLEKWACNRWFCGGCVSASRDY